MIYICCSGVLLVNVLLSQRPDLIRPFSSSGKAHVYLTAVSDWLWNLSPVCAKGSLPT
jgi:hypothetical protein